ncbi:cellulose binding domain-containing protein [Geodermatophilus sp. SYSU D00758]
MRSTRRRSARRWKLLVVPVAVVAGLAIALLVGTATGSGQEAGSVTAPSDRPGRDGSGAGAQAAGRPVVFPPPGPGTGCRVDYAGTSWPGQFVAEVTLTNTGAATIDDWELTFTFPGDQVISRAWDATYTRTGRSVSMTNEDCYSALIRPGAGWSFGFLGTWTSDDTAPTEFRVNGTPCT